MKNHVASNPSRVSGAWPTLSLIDNATESHGSFFSWWYHLTAVPEVPASASFLKREASRRSRLLSNVLFFYLIMLALALPVCLVLPNRFDLLVDGLLLVTGILALLFNRRGLLILAGGMVVFVFQIALTIALFTTLPLDEGSIQIYDLYIVAELLAVSLLPARSIFVVAALNTLIVLASLLFQPHTQAFAQDLRVEFIAILIRPIVLFVVVSGVAYAWSYSTSHAIARADRAEMIANLEHVLVEQKRDLEEGIEQILQTHVAVANGNFNARAPLTQDSSLWQIARALNTLLVRLQRAALAEKELQRVEQAVTTSVALIQRADQQHQLPQLAFTQSTLDPLVAALQGKTLAYVQSPFRQKPASPSPLPHLPRQLTSHD